MKRIFKFITAAALVALTVSCGEPVHKTGVVAHRGYWNCEEAGYARNSIKALEMAQKEGFWGSELDIQMSSDGVVLVVHGPKVDTMLIWDTPSETLRNFRLENGEPIPTFDEYLTQGEKSDKTILVCELKEQKNIEKENEMTDKVIAAIKAHNLYDPERVAFISFSLNICKKIAAECPEFINQFLGSKISPDELIGYGINGVDYNHKVFADQPEWYGQARAHEMSINAWTVNDSTNIQKMLDLGVDYITTDEPLRVRGMIGGTEKVNK